MALVRRLLRWLAIGFAIALAILIVAPLVLLAIGIQVEVTQFAPLVAERGSAALGRELRLDGPVYVVPSYWPTLEVHDVSIADPYGGEGAEFARLARARVVLSLISILRGKIELDELSADGVRLNLVRYADGDASWAFELPAAEAETPDPAPEAAEHETGQTRIFEELEELAFRDIAVTWRDETSGVAEQLMVEECLGAAARGEPIRLSIRGRFREVPFAVRVGAGHLADLLTARPELPLDLELDLGTAHMEIALQLAELDEAALDPDTAAVDSVRAAQARGSYRLAFSVDRLDRLNRPLSLMLPPLGPVDVRAEAKIGGDEWSLHTLRIGVGDTRLVGNASIARGAARPLATFELTSRSFRVDDFLAEGWSAAGGAESEPEADTTQASAEPGAAEDQRALLDPEVMRLIDARLRVRVDDVVSGDESLGGGELRAELANGRVQIDPLRVDVPGGTLRLKASLQADATHTVARIEFETEHFDVGVLARRTAPDSTMGGILDVDMLVEADSPDPNNLMAYADGRLDVSLRPVNLEAGLIDLWAVNLVASVLPVVSGGDSNVNCVVAVLDLEDGIMTSRSILIDTSRIQVGGRASVDFHEQRVSALLQPRPKRPQFFSLGTPVKVDGDFEDFGVGVSALDLAGTAVRMVTDLATYPARLLFIRPLPKDGEEACAQARLRIEPQP